MTVWVNAGIMLGSFNDAKVCKDAVLLADPARDINDATISRLDAGVFLDERVVFEVELEFRLC